MEFGAQSIIYLFHPRSSNSRLLIYHQGHGGDFILGVDTIQFFLRHGYMVAAFTMPLLGMNGPLVFETPDGNITLRGHSDLRLLESEVFSPLNFFVEPVIVSLNYALAHYLELYVLGTYGDTRRQIQVLNRYDPCCFGDTEYVLYEEQVRQTAQRVGNGSFSVFLDETHREHKISEAALDVILNDLERP